jgi:1,2-diacylglycerol 3-beta-galactosyltransferase
MDMVVSVIPNFNRVLAASIKHANPGTPFVTILTDLADYPPHFWIEKESEYVICGSERAAQQAKALGHDGAHVFRTSGMVIHPKFYETTDIDRYEERERRGLKTECPTALVLFGGSGSKAMLDIAERLEHCREELQVIFICGHNDSLAARLRGRKSRYRFFVDGFTTEVPLYMRISDFLIGKPGPGCISEALACSLPVIVESNAKTLPQERYNAEWVEKERLGVVVRSFGDINGAVSTILSTPAYKQNAVQVRNRAVFEIPEVLQRIWEIHSGTAVAATNSLDGVRAVQL